MAITMITESAENMHVTQCRVSSGSLLSITSMSPENLVKVKEIYNTVYASFECMNFKAWTYLRCLLVALWIVLKFIVLIQRLASLQI